MRYRVTFEFDADPGQDHTEAIETVVLMERALGQNPRGVQLLNEVVAPWHRHNTLINEAPPRRTFKVRA